MYKVTIRHRGESQVTSYDNKIDAWKAYKLAKNLGRSYASDVGVFIQGPGF